jgi:hypothetical protein
MTTWALRLAAVLVLALVFLSYLRPDFMLDLANRIYLCF